MSEPNEATVAPSFPLPPPFYKLYSANSGSNGAEGGPRFNGPPPPTIPSTSFSALGQIFDAAEPQVAPLNGRRVYDHREDGSVDLKAELLKLNKELIFLFLELLRSLTDSPSNYAPQLNQVNQVLDNMQHLVNCLRPQQAIANLEYVLELQVKEKQEALLKIRSQFEAVDKLLATTAAALVETCETSHADGAPAPDSGVAVKVEDPMVE